MSLDLNILRDILMDTRTTLPAADEGLRQEEVSQLIPAAVLFPIVTREEGQHVLFTRRTEELRDHAGQISFPGGRVEQSDADPVETALREAEEEIGLDRSRVTVLGYLPRYHTVTGFSISPVVARIQTPFSLKIDPREVAETFEVPLSFLLDRKNFKRHSLFYRGQQRTYLAIPYERHYIWGATAGMIASLVSLLDGRQVENTGQAGH